MYNYNTVIVLSHFPVKSMFLEKYIIAYETTNRHSDSSTFLLKTVYTVLIESEGTIDSHTGVLRWMSQTDRQQSIYTSIFYVTSLDRGLLAWHQVLKGLSCRWRGNRIYSWRWSVLGCFFGRTVDSRVGKLPIKRGIHIGLEEQEWFRDTNWLSPASVRGSYSNTLVSLACFNSNGDTWGVFFYPHSLCCV